MMTMMVVMILMLVIAMVLVQKERVIASRYTCGALLHNTLVEQCCGTLLLHARVHTLRTLLREMFVGHPCKALLDIFVGLFVDRLWDTLVGHSCGTLLCDTLLGQCCGAPLCREILQGTLVGHACGTLL